MKTRRFDFTYRPLTISSYIEVVGSIPDIQQYDSDTGEPTPDYEIANMGLVLQPRVNIHDSDGILADGEVTSSLANVKWTKIKGGGNTIQTLVITSSNTKYSIVTSGANTGRLTVKENVDVDTQITLRFEADYTDTRTSQVHKITLDHVVQCVRSVSAPPVLELDCPETFVWNPWREPKNISVTAMLLHGEQPMTTNVAFSWEKKRADGSWSVIGTEAYDDFGWSMNAAGTVMTQDMSLMGDRLDMRVRATYPGKPTLGEGSPMKTFTLIRRLPNYEYDFGGVPEDIEPDVKTIYPKLVVTDRDGVVEDPLGEVSATWKTAAGVASGSLSYEVVGGGMQPPISTSKINSNGMVLGVEVVDRGSRKVLTQGGAVLLQDGKVIFDR